jgi:hypothetical protein
MLCHAISVVKWDAKNVFVRNGRNAQVAIVEGAGIISTKAACTVMNVQKKERLKMEFKMEKVILEQIKKFIADNNENTSKKNLRKAGFADGYLLGLNDIKDIIDMGETLAGIKNAGD